MNTKLTLNIERGLINKAKKYARNQHRSLSDIVENYLSLITSHRKRDRFKLTSNIRSLKGTVKVSKKINYKKELAKSLSNKYL